MMSSPSSPRSDFKPTPQEQPRQRSTSPATRIRELSVIDADVASLLRSAGLALKSLSSGVTATPPPNCEDKDADGDAIIEHDDEAPDAPLSRATAAFSTHNTSYLHTVQSVQARLRRQAYALEEAGIIPSEAAASNADTLIAQTQGRGGLGSAEREAMPVTNGGLGKFDVGWLNSRKDEVGRRKEVELWREMRVLVEALVEKEEASVGSLGDDGAMDVREKAPEDGNKHDLQDGMDEVED